MNLKLLTMTIVSAVLASLALAAYGERRADIVDTAVGSKDFTVLVKAVKAAGLVEALKAKGPYTVFAPTDAAFAKLEKANPGILESLLKPENKKQLAEILKYHVVPGRIMAADVTKLKEGTQVKTLQGSSFSVSLKGGVKVDGAKVVKTDIDCTNGVIHVIDTVILPKSGS
jgi:uncharacterized surface protein with fasciclin (FAS1) repeats